MSRCKRLRRGESLAQIANMSNDDTRDDCKAAKALPAFHFPAALPGDVDEDDAEDLVFLCCLPTDEAEEMIALLASEGILCHLDDAPAEVSAATQGVEDKPTERLLVQAEDLAAARVVVERPEALRGEAEAEWAANAEDREAQLIDGWICPRCNKRSLVPLPLSPGWQRARLGCFGLAVLPLLGMGLAWALPFNSLIRFVNDPPRALSLAWVVTLIILAAAVFVGARRDRGCSECGWDSTSRTDAPNQL